MANSKRSLTKTLFFYISLSIVGILVLLATYLIISSVQSVNTNIENRKQQYIEYKKSIIKNQINLTVQFVNYEKFLLKNNNELSAETLQEKILNQIAKIRFENNGYIFVVSYDGTTLMNDVQPELIGKNQWDITDPKGIKIVQEERKAVENPDGDFIFYSWYKPNEKVPTPKISFVKGIPEWEWMIGTGIYLEDINTIISQENAQLKKQVRNNIYIILLVFSAIILLLLFIVRFVAKKIQYSFRIYSNFFKRAVAKSDKIDINNLYFSEFIDPAISANEMINKLNDAQNELLELNRDLETKVKERTIEIIQQKEEILAQNEEILAQKDELEKHRNNLEKLVVERTRDLELAKNKAEESDRLKSSFLANMSHEIRTPMNAIIGFSNLLIENNLDISTRNDLTKEITKNGFSLLYLIDNILDLAKIETNQLKIEKKEFNLKDLIHDLYLSFLEIIQNKELEFIFTNINEKGIIIYSDPSRLKQILKNLLENAVKFTEKGSIKIGYTYTDQHVSIFVKDSGIGMDNKQLSYVFSRFSKVEDEKQKLYRGAGLGLSICKNLSMLLHGNVMVESELNKGSTFYIKLPLNETAQNDKKEKQPDDEPSYKWKNKTILIAEDDESNFNYFKLLLADTNVNILHAQNGKDAVKLCNEHNPDLILMDIKMPEMNGLEATRIIRIKHPQIPIIAQTAYTMEDDEKITLQAGCNAYMQKPIQKTYLLNIIAQYFK